MVTAATIRIAGVEHLDAIADIWHRGWMEVHLGQVPKALLAHRNPTDILSRAAERLDGTYVALLEGRPVGFILVHENEVEQLYVDEGARRTGVAGALLAKGEALIGACCDTAWLAVVEGNVRARRFYEHHGWEMIGEYMHPARIADGTILVPTLRYEKRLIR